MRFGKSFQLMLISSLVTEIGWLAAGFAVPLVVYRQTGSVLTAGSLATITGMCRLVFGVLGGSLADKWDRKTILVANIALQMPMYLVLAYLLWANSFSMSLFTLVLALCAVVGAIGSASAEACVPRLVEKEKLAAAEGVMQARMQTIWG